MHMYVCPDVHTYIHTNACTYVYTYTLYVRIYVCMQAMHVNTRALVFRRQIALSHSRHLQTHPSVCAHAQVHVNVHVYAHKHMEYVHMYVCMYYVCMHACMHVCMFVCMNACMHVCMNYRCDQCVTWASSPKQPLPHSASPSDCTSALESLMTLTGGPGEAA